MFNANFVADGQENNVFMRNRNSLEHKNNHTTYLPSTQAGAYWSTNDRVSHLCQASLVPMKENENSINGYRENCQVFK